MDGQEQGLNTPPLWFQLWLRSQGATATPNMSETTSNLPILAGGKPGRALPPLLEFYGDPEKLDAWIQQAKAKMATDYANCTDFVQFWALNGALRGKAIDRMEGWIRENGNTGNATAASFFHQLTLVFSDPQSKQRAQRKLESLRQGNRTFMDVYMEWQSLVIKAGGSTWPDDVKKMTLDRVLNDELAKSLITAPSTTNFEAYCGVLKEIDDKMRAFKATRVQARTAKSSNDHMTHLPTQQRHHIEKQEPMDWQSTVVPLASTQVKRAKWVDREEINKRKELGRCLRCGASGHRVKSCPYAPARLPTQSNSSKAYWEPELEDDDSTLHEAEN